MDAGRRFRTLAVGCVAGVATLAIVGAGVVGANARPVVHSVVPEDLIPEFGREQQERDALTQDLLELADEGGVDPESVRMIGQSSFGLHWVALSLGGDVCLLTSLSDQSVGALSCSSRQQFYLSGVSQGLGSSTAPGTVVYLLPDDVAESDVEQAVVDSVEGQGARVDGGTSGFNFELLGEARILVYGQADASKIGDVQISRSGQEDLILHDMGAAA